MIERSSELCSVINSVASNAVRCYAQNILTTEWLEEEILKECEVMQVAEDQLPRGLLTRIAQRICSRRLCEAWRSPDREQRELAFANLRRYLEFSLQHSRYGRLITQYTHAADDILHQALADLHETLLKASAGPDDPATFLKWTQTIVLRHAYAFLQKHQREQHVSLDDQPEGFAEQYVDSSNADPQEQVLRKELQQTLKNAILTLSNPRYRDVLIYTYLAGMSESELAAHLGVQVQDIYMWRHRALKALRSKPEVEQALRSWLR